MKISISTTCILCLCVCQSVASFSDYPFKFENLPRPKYCKELSSLGLTQNSRLLEEAGLTRRIRNGSWQVSQDTFDSFLPLEEVGNTSYQAVIRAGYGRDVGDAVLSVTKFDFINGIRLNDVSFGLGIGLRFLSEDNGLAVPLFINARTVPSNKKVTPMAGIDVGTLIKSNVEDAEKTLFLGFEVGAYIGGGASSILITAGFERFDIQTSTAVRGFPGGGLNRQTIQAVEVVSVNFSIFF